MILRFENAGQRDRVARTNGFLEKVRERISSATTLHRDEPLAKRTTLRVGGKADLFVEPANVEDLAEIVRACSEETVPLFVLGRGSNLLVRDGGFDGVVVCLSQPVFSSIEVVDGGIRAGAGARLKQVAIQARNAQLAGFEFLEGIPGSVGGALRMNAGAMGSCMFELVESVQFMDRTGKIQTAAGSSLGARYRSCDAFDEQLALFAVLKGRPGERSEIERRMSEFSRKRWASQPAAPSAGCMFKNPAGTSAGKLIDELGLKGTCVGGAVVSQEHGNFLIARNNATARDVLELIEVVRRKVREASGIELESEVQVIGQEINPLQGGGHA